jgi:acyl-CoA-binding protein
VVDLVRQQANGPKPAEEPSVEAKLEVYALFKQATVGDVNIAQPWYDREKKKISLFFSPPLSD